jgi:P pilus assembly chaperone PapD
LTFTNQLVGTASAGQGLTVTNSGTANLAITSVGLTGSNASDFAKSADTCAGATLTPNGTCTLSVTFTPSATGSRTATLSINDNAANSPQTVSLSGTGT